MMNRLVLKSIFSPDVDLRSWVPDSEEDVFLALELEISSSENLSESNMFFVTLSTSEGLKRNRKNFLLVENRTLVVSQFDYFSLKSSIEQILEKCCRNSWSESCEVLQRYFLWEYEDFERV